MGGGGLPLPSVAGIVPTGQASQRTEASMAYRVTKWVKGKPYAYLQRSFREKGHVRTVSEYLGPLAGDGHGSQTPANTNPDNPPALPATPTTPQPVERKKLSLHGPAPTPTDGLRISARLDRAGLSERTMRHQHAAVIRSLARIGIPSECVPPVIVRHGSGLAVKPRWWRGGFVVTLPRFERTRGPDARAAYGLALGRASLEAIRTEKPETYARLSVVMDASFRSTNANVLQFVKSSNHRDAWTWGVCLRFFGYANPIRGREATALGLTDYGSRKAWDDEAAAVLSRVLTRGWAATSEQAASEARKAAATERRAVEALRNSRGVMGWIRRPELRRRLRASIARRAAVSEMQTKLAILRGVFDA